MKRSKTKQERKLAIKKFKLNREEQILKEKNSLKYGQPFYNYDEPIMPVRSATMPSITMKIPVDNFDYIGNYVDYVNGGTWKISNNNAFVSFKTNVTDVPDEIRDLNIGED